MKRPREWPMEVEQAVEQFWLTLPHCCGYPDCDGDLVGIPHAKKCPLFGRKELTKLEFAAAFYRRMQSIEDATNPVCDPKAVEATEPPDAYCVTDGKGDCISTDPRCMHQVKAEAPTPLGTYKCPKAYCTLETPHSHNYEPPTEEELRARAQNRADEFLAERESRKRCVEAEAPRGDQPICAHCLHSKRSHETPTFGPACDNDYCSCLEYEALEANSAPSVNIEQDIWTWWEEQPYSMPKDEQSVCVIIAAYVRHMHSQTKEKG